MSVKISKLNVKIGKKEISLTLEEAKELQKILNETFGEQKTMIIPLSPVIIERIRERPVIEKYPWRHWDITWTAKGENTNYYTLTCKATE